MAVDGKQGKLAVVDATRRVVHFVTLSADLEVQQHTTKDVPLVAKRISFSFRLLGLSGQRQLIVSPVTEKKFAVLPADGARPPAHCTGRHRHPGCVDMPTVHRPDQSRLCDL